MKTKHYILFLFILIGYLSSAQDIIYKIDGNEIKAKILEIDQLNIKYRNFDQQQGPIRNIIKSEVFMIKYQDGSIEKFTTMTKTNTIPLNDSTKNVSLKMPDNLDYQIKEAKSLKRTGTNFLITGLVSAFVGGVFYIISEAPANKNDKTLKNISYLFLGTSIPLTITGITITSIGISKIKDLSAKKAEIGLAIVPFNNFTGYRIESVQGLSVSIRYLF